VSSTWAEAEAQVIELRAEVERLRAEVAASDAALGVAIHERDHARVQNERLEARLLASAAAEDRLRAVLAETPENHMALARIVWGERSTIGLEQTLSDRAGAILAALRARAGMEPTP
jgi:hypothetical protein